jgi:hypothetical protein
MFWILITKKQLKRWTLFLKYKGDNPRAADRVSRSVIVKTKSE